MKKLDLNQLTLSLCADELKELFALLSDNYKNITCAKDSNHKIINRERNNRICPHCGQNHTVKNGKSFGKQKYICKDCKKSFSDTTNTIVFNSNKPYELWVAFLDCELKRMSLRDTAAELNISVTTAFLWRHKLMKAVSKINKTSRLSGLIEADASYYSINLKGTKPNKMPRWSKKSTSSTYRGISHHKVCVITAIDESDNIVLEIAGLGSESLNKLRRIKDRFASKAKLVTDSKATFMKFAEEMDMELKQIPAGAHVTKEGYSIQTLNGLISEFETWKKRYRGVAIRHFQHYLDWFIYLKKLKYTTEYKERLDKTYIAAVTSYEKLITAEVYIQPLPIDLYVAYGEYQYGIFAENHQ